MDKDTLLRFLRCKQCPYSEEEIIKHYDGTEGSPYPIVWIFCVLQQKYMLDVKIKGCIYQVD